MGLNDATRELPWRVLGRLAVSRLAHKDIDLFSGLSWCPGGGIALPCQVFAILDQHSCAKVSIVSHRSGDLRMQLNLSTATGGTKALRLHKNRSSLHLLRRTNTISDLVMQFERYRGCRNELTSLTANRE